MSDRSIADEVESVGLERLAVRQKPAEGLENAKAQIEQYDDPKGAAIGGVCACSLRIACAAAIRCFVIRHEALGNTSSNCRRKPKLRMVRGFGAGGVSSCLSEVFRRRRAPRSIR